MTGFFYECPKCTQVTAFDPSDANLPSRTCEVCFEEGCEDCMPDGECAEDSEDFCIDPDDDWGDDEDGWSEFD